VLIENLFIFKSYSLFPTTPNPSLERRGFNVETGFRGGKSI